LGKALRAWFARKKVPLDRPVYGLWGPLDYGAMFSNTLEKPVRFVPRRPDERNPMPIRSGLGGPEEALWCEPVEVALQDLKLESPRFAERLDHIGRRTPEKAVVIAYRAILEHFERDLLPETVKAAWQAFVRYVPETGAPFARDVVRDEKLTVDYPEILMLLRGRVEKEDVPGLVRAAGSKGAVSRVATDLLYAFPEETDRVVAELLRGLTLDETGDYGPNTQPYARLALWLGGERTLKVLREKNRAQKEKLGLGGGTLDDAEYELTWILK